MATWNSHFFAPNCACCLTLWGCGCIPIYQIIVMLAPFNAVFIPIELPLACFWAFLFWFGSVYAVGQGSVVFIVALIMFHIGAKNKLGIDEDSFCTAIRSFFCAPCVIGQLMAQAKQARAREAPYLMVGDPVYIA
eukprot:TRINITY_DN34308_c0_g1_i1.p1 TRINITY_DN34308_c0_g1~~TRINITY_DN34308_c0_g1_i1.p1  ORF type:complete len:158 (-),score=24.29 TRINITY_DN34308_c0_g1_i1:79-483(-)